ncbi:carboxypeptidase-like regulatory domain-containing protein, partial [Bacteroidota bacterium]
MKKSLIFISIFLMCNFSYAQFLLQGNINDDKGIPLVGANIELMPLKIGTISDINGNFHFNDISEGDYTIHVSFIGFRTFEKQIHLSEDLNINIRMETGALMTDEVI